MESDGNAPERRTSDVVWQSSNSWLRGALSVLAVLAFIAHKLITKKS